MRKWLILSLVVQFGWIDHEPPPFELLQRLIDDMFNYLSQYPNNGIAIHCKVDITNKSRVVTRFLTLHGDMLEVLISLC